MHQTTQTNIFGVVSVPGTPPFSESSPILERSLSLAAKTTTMPTIFRQEWTLLGSSISLFLQNFERKASQSTVPLQCIGMWFGGRVLEKKKSPKRCVISKRLFQWRAFSTYFTFSHKIWPHITFCSQRRWLFWFGNESQSGKKEPKKPLSNIWEIESGGKYKTNVQSINSGLSHKHQSCAFVL